MATRFITRALSRLYESATAKNLKMILIFGDEVEVSGPAVNEWSPVTFRGKAGFIRTNHLGDNPALELYFIDVGQGDSTFIVTPGRKKILIDGGQNDRALGFLAWKYRLKEAGPAIDIDLLVLSHADDDHLNGLVPIVRHPKINVRQVVHSGIAKFKAKAFQTGLGNLDPAKKYLTTRHKSLSDLSGLSLSRNFEAWRQALADKGVSYTAVDTKSAPLDIGDPEITIEVLGPRLEMMAGQPVLPWFKDEAHTINGHSVILRLTYNQISTLLSGDVNIVGAEHLMAEPALAAKMDAHVLKAPHHGSHEFAPAFLKAVRPQISVISSGDDRDHGHPRAVFIGGVGLASRSTSPLVFSTEIAANFVEIGETVDPKEEKSLTKEEASLATKDFTKSSANKTAAKLFKRRLHGMINVRTDGRELYAARRVAASFWWESYGPLTTAPRPPG